MRASTSFFMALGMSAAALNLATFVPSELAYAADAKKDAKKEELPKKFTPAVQKALAETQTAIAAKNFELAKTKLAAAEAVPNPNDWDKFVMAQFRLQIGQNTHENEYLRPGVEVMAESAYTSPETRPALLRNLLVFAFNAKDDAKTQKYADAILKLNPNDTEIIALLGQRAADKGDLTTADQYFSRAIKAEEASGKPAGEEQYIRLAGIRERAKAPNFAETLRQLVEHYPSPRNWQFALREFQTRTHLMDRPGLDVYRLMSAVGALTSQGDYIEYAEAATKSGVPLEGKNVILKGMASNIFDDRGKVAAKEDLAEAEKKLAVDQRTFAQFEAPAKAAKSGDADAALADGFLGYGQYDKAIEAYKRSLAKGGYKTKNATEATLRLGIAQYLGGDKAGSLQTFKGLQSNDARFVELASYWALAAGAK